MCSESEDEGEGEAEGEAGGEGEGELRDFTAEDDAVLWCVARRHAATGGREAAMQQLAARFKCSVGQVQVRGWVREGLEESAGARVGERGPGGA